jgi:hypothetical protein
MEEDKALEIIRALADGSDPYTGEVFGAESPYQNAQTARALFTAIDALEAAARRKKRKRNLPERVGKPWDDDESKLLIKKFDDGVLIGEIAREHKRTPGAIRSQLMKLGKLAQQFSEEQTPTAAGQ